ncbi:MAG: general secretion pathway protein GspB [Methylococcaceae bacterium]|nr:general secretion pathway protein GspB [Methylococcaceae bacterium]
MSYILDALRKSEQQRQATQPETMTERILVNPSQPVQKSSRWLIILVAINLIAISMMAWIFFHKNQAETLDNAGVSTYPAADRKFHEKTASPLVSNNPDEQANQIQSKSSSDVNDEAGPSEPSIAEMLEEKSAAVKPIEAQRTVHPTPNKKPATVKKEKKSALTPKELPSPAQEPSSNTRTGSQKLNINVFSYAEKPEDRFVIIDMVKYKSGQHIKGDVKLKEIRSDSIVLQDEKGTFTVDRP